MKQDCNRNSILYRIPFWMLVLILSLSLKTPSYGSEDFSIELETEGRYHIQSGVSEALAEQIALYDAKRKAVEMAARYLARRHLIEPHDRDREEIYSLAARKIEAAVLEKKKPIGQEGGIFFIRINATIRPTDFVIAEILDEKLEKDDKAKSFLQEMEPSLAVGIDPGKDIAEAYRLIREQKWRMALIYLERLEVKYPGWSEIYSAKALGYYALNDDVDFHASLKKACRLGNDHACQELKSFKKIRNSPLHH